ncbi:YceI family protein [Acidiferrimicrobium sp. IK]|uniref:YceI family protein n=1 Tax=Acidiferrimicrobium sp. IK TaxID=2871700 RepID=UPI0021CB3EB3|nr:YceI family protein [Acidiferrimicrobium sp. IK]MCU4183340.1 YceI family protein [Acidiferrimicrobium sp. IK]
MTSAAQPDPRLQQAAGTWTLDPSATSIELRTKAMWGLVKVKAVFAANSGEAVIGSDGTTRGSLVVDPASVDSGVKKRDAHLRTADFLEVERYPTITYSATDATAGPDGTVVVEGTLEVHGTARPLRVPVSIAELDQTSATITAEVDMDRREWGLSWAKMGAKVDNHITVRARFTKQ